MEHLCNQIHMPPAVTQILLSIHRDPAFSPQLHKLLQKDTWEEGLEEVKAALGEDPDGFKLLCCMLRCALSAQEEFHRLGLSDKIYYDTMGCFSRFVREHMVSYGRYGFDRGFWTVRQISCRLMRIGQLEYELTSQNGIPRIGLHIPTDAQLLLPGLRQSYLEARELINRLFPEYQDAAIFCHSWLLSPVLLDMLPPESNILAFQRSFQITAFPYPNDGVLQWVFKNPHLPPEKFPENTSLQRKLKAFLLAGGIFSDARGILVSDPFI